MAKLDLIQPLISKISKGKNWRRFCLCLLPFVFSFVIGSCSSGALLDQAQTAWDGGDYAMAAERYERFLKDNPRSEQAAYARFRVAMICYRDLKQYDRAIEHYIHLIDDFPKSAEIYQARLRLAECYAFTRKQREAINEYEIALPLAPDVKERRRVQLSIGELYYEMDDLGQALAEFQKALGADGYDEIDERASLRMGGIRYLRNEYKDALASYDLVSVKTQDSSIRRIARLAMADCYERMSQYDVAVKLLEATEPDPNSPDYIRKRIASIRELQRMRYLNPPSSPTFSKVRVKPKRT
ncbi:MAG: tetratricopeptide repeat protein [Blastocatellia bacterium]|nr:tetratricopeptide repeat protein [Blastocatellia bacterium]